MQDASYEYERELTEGALVVGVDEVGRGPLAGPVLAAAALLGPEPPITGLRDSKALSAKKRDALTAEILASAKIGIGGVAASGIDAIGIARATELAMQRAIAALAPPPGVLILVDGNRAPGLPGFAVMTEVKADASCPSVSAAAIVAKVTRDRAMARLACRYEAYHWHTNKGYGSKTHREALLELGPTRHHRMTFLTKILA